MLFGQINTLILLLFFPSALTGLIIFMISAPKNSDVYPNLKIV
ncbi:Uncharacterised protein [Yersinia thracica]|uniref:Uncharacterized protein n=1 Tax=Yersinia thracica TaxID=2890319 RepID=A0A0T9P6E0_9GAMM|nr:Uncharacterised protein [Yersinia thracica]